MNPRETMIAGLRELADFLDQNPEVPIDDTGDEITVQRCGVDQFRAACATGRFRRSYEDATTIYAHFPSAEPERLGPGISLEIFAPIAPAVRTGAAEALDVVAIDD